MLLKTSDTDLHKTLGYLFLYLSHQADFKFTRQLFKTKLNIEWHNNWVYIWLNFKVQGRSMSKYIVYFPDIFNREYNMARSHRRCVWIEVNIVNG
jgi:hypothetical protein